jgi:hypothetical protein
VDPILSGNWDAVKGALVEGGYEESIEGAKQFLRDWATTMKPIYLMVCMPLHPAPPPPTPPCDDGGVIMRGARGTEFCCPRC